MAKSNPRSSSGIIHRSYQIMFLHLVLQKKYFIVAKQAVYFSVCPGTFYVPGTFDGTYIGCIGIKKQME